MQYRLKKNSEFDKIFRSGKKAHSKNLIMLYTADKRCLKVGFSVTKKHGKAVKRNRIKRLLRAAFYDISEIVPKNLYIVFIPRVAESYSYAEFKDNFLYLLKREGIIK